MDVLEKLKACCSEDPERKSIASPFASVFLGRKWACATDGRALAALPFDGDLRTDGPDVASILPPGFTPLGSASISDLRAWTGQPIVEACPGCDGEGEDDTPDCWCQHCTGTHPCETCGGKGEITKKRLARFFDGVLDRNLLAKALATAPESGEVRVSHAKPRDAFFLRMEGWLAAVMPYDPESEETKAVGGPVFP